MYSGELHYKCQFPYKSFSISKIAKFQSDKLSSHFTEYNVRPSFYAHNHVFVFKTLQLKIYFDRDCEKNVSYGTDGISKSSKK